MLLEKTIHDLIDREDFAHHSQGLYSTDNGEKVGEEIFFRTDTGNPEVVFQCANQVQRLYELETKSIYKALQIYHSKKNPQKNLIFINIYPSTISHPEFPRFLNKIAQDYPSIKSKIVFEMIETEEINDIPFLKERVLFLKNSGYFIAIDDVGKGWSSMSMIIELEPHFIKLDKYFSLHLSNSLLKQEMIKSLLSYAQNSRAKIILEGIEKESDFSIAKLLGIHICQGYLLSRPKLLTDKNV
jgi:EAL domain-containing protein (putative c-di-GMP-specific phosphodiesterase class I)